MQWHQLDCIQTVCTSLQTDNHTNTSSLNFYRPDALPPDTQPIASNHSVQQVHNKPNAYDKSTASCTTNRTNPTSAQTPLVRFVADLLYSSLQRWLSTDKVKCTTNVEQNKFTTTFTASYRPGGGETICPPAPAVGSLTCGGSTSVHGRVRSSHIHGGRPAAGSQRAYILGWDRQPGGQTDGSRYRLMLPYGGGITNPQQINHISACP